MDRCDQCDQDLSKLNEYNIATHYGFQHGNWGYLDQWYKKKGVPPQNRVHARLPLKDLLKPRFYQRLWKCAMCKEPLVYDALKRTVTCRCKTMKDLEVDKKELQLYWTPTVVLEA